jgi:hypothetical protein
MKTCDRTNMYGPDDKGQKTGDWDRLGPPMLTDIS